jgi:putative transposase
LGPARYLLLVAVLGILYRRRVVGWKLDHRMDAALVIGALKRALGLRRMEAETLLLHTDQGSQYRATTYRDLLRKHVIVCSMSAKGCCWENAVVGSFFSSLKLELDLDDNREEPISTQQLQRYLTYWIEGYDNRERRHSTIGYLSPIADEQRFIAAPTLPKILMSLRSVRTKQHGGLQSTAASNLRL